MKDLNKKICIKSWIFYALEREVIYFKSMVNLNIYRQDIFTPSLIMYNSTEILQYLSLPFKDVVLDNIFFLT